MLERKSKDYAPERAILVGAITPLQDEEKITEYLDELEFLASTAGAETIARFTQKLATPNPKTFVGSGKLSEIIEFIKEEKIDVCIFDDELNTAFAKFKAENVTDLIVDLRYNGGGSVRTATYLASMKSWVSVFKSNRAPAPRLTPERLCLFWIAQSKPTSG